MKIILPVPTTEATLTATNILENDYPVWAGGTTYARGDIVMSTTTHTIYRSLVDANLGTNPDTEAVAFADPLVISDGPRQWQIISATNRWRMFDERPSLLATRADNIAVTITPASIVGGLAGFEIDATTVDVTVTSPGLERLNQFTYSEQFDNAAWTNVNVVVTPNTDFASSGLLVADTLTVNTGTTFPRVQQSLALTAGTWTFSVEAMAGTAAAMHGTVELPTFETLRFFADLTTGATTQTTELGTIAATSRTETTAIAGMLRYIWEIEVAEPGTYDIFFGPSDAYQSTSGVLGETIIAWGAQFNAGTHASYQWITDAATWDTVVLQRTIEMQDNSNVVDWYTYFFEPLIPLTEFVVTDLPPYGDAIIDVTINKPADTAACGQLVVGTVRPFGIGVVAPGSGFEGYDLSYIEVDEFGNRITIKRAASRISRFEILMDNDTLLGIDGLLRQLRGGTPAVWIGDDDVSRAAINYGFSRGYTVGYRNKRESIITLQILGIT